MSQTVRRRHLAAALCGNALEFYDFTTYAFFAVQIGHVFFPVHSAFGSLMLSLATFGVGFAGRPLGGILIGAYGDRAGRKPAMKIISCVIGTGTVLSLTIDPSIAFSMMRILRVCDSSRRKFIRPRCDPLTKYQTPRP